MQRRLRKTGKMLVVGFALIQLVGTCTVGEVVVSPLEQAGLKPVFAENFTNGTADVMRYSPAYGSREQYHTFIQPGAIFMGQKGATENTEQQINFWPAADAGVKHYIVELEGEASTMQAAETSYRYLSGLRF